jgi:hypothetical protein
MLGNIVLAMRVWSDFEIESLTADALTIGCFIGLFFGMALLWAFSMILTQAWRQNFKMYYLELDEAKRRSVDEKLDYLFMYTDDLAAQTNTRMFKSMHNDLIKLRAILAQRKMNS